MDDATTRHLLVQLWKKSSANSVHPALSTSLVSCITNKCCCFRLGNDTSSAVWNVIAASEFRIQFTLFLFASSGEGQTTMANIVTCFGALTTHRVYCICGFHYFQLIASTIQAAASFPSSGLNTPSTTSSSAFDLRSCAVLRCERKLGHLISKVRQQEQITICFVFFPRP